MTFQLISSDPRQRDPRRCPVGLYLVNSLASGGDQAFCWFLHEKDALQFLHERHCGESCAQSYAQEDDPELIACRAITEAVALSDLPIDQINQDQCHYAIRWAGKFEDLLAETTRFASEIRNDFSPVFHGQTVEQASPEQIDRFADHLGQYAERYPSVSYQSPFRPNIRRVGL